MPKIYKTMQGEQIDIEALFRKHELSQAVGNMNANARGDELGPGGSVVKTREQKAREYYQKKKAMKEVEERQRAQASKAEAAAPAPASTPATAPERRDLTDPEGIEGLENNE